jgi:hypothetical protein
MTEQLCGQRAVLTQGGRDGYQSGSCVEPKDHGPDHRDADGNTWTESVR